ncbi:MAG: flippase [Pseudomonadota bacterium]
MRDFISKIASSVLGSGTAARIARSVVGSAGVQASASLLSFVVGIILARNLGPEGYGVYAYAFAILMLLMVLAEAGVPTLLIREVAAAEGRQDWGVLKGAIKRGIQFVGLISATISLIGFVILSFITDQISDDYVHTIAIMLFMLPVAVLSKTLSYGLRGLQKVVQAQAIELLLRHAVVIAVIGAIALYFSELLQPWVGMAAQLAAVALSALIATLTLRQSLPKQCLNAVPQFKNTEWFKSALPFTLIGGALILNKSVYILMIGWFLGASDVGIYRVAVQGATLVAFVLGAVSAAVGPTLAKLNAQGETAKLQKLVSRTVQLIAVPSAIIAGALIFEGDYVLNLIFGPEFIGASLALAILCVGQFIVAVLGISGPLLSMSGFEAQISKSIWWAAFANIVLNASLIPNFGIAGAATATAVTLSGWSVYMVWLSFKKLRIVILPIEITPTN